MGGQGASYNLFPITADANAKHLAYVEKFIKAQLDARYVIYYEVNVKHKNPQSDNQGIYIVDGGFQFFWHLYDSNGNRKGKLHKGIIESTFNQTGKAPFDLRLEYSGEYDKLNRGKKTPQVNAYNWQWNLPSYSSPSMSKMGYKKEKNPNSFVPINGFSGSSINSVKIPDFSGKKVKVYNNLGFISLRNKDAKGLKPGQKIKVSTGTEKILTVNPISGGWTRIYF